MQNHRLCLLAGLQTRERGLCVGEIGIETQGLLVMLDGVGDFAGVFQGDGEVEMRFGVIGAETQRLLVLVDGVLCVAHLLQGNPEIEVRLGVIRVETQRLLKLPDCLRRFA